MRRLSAFLLVLFAVTTAFAQEQEPRKLKNPRARLGRAMILNPAQPLSVEDRAALEAQGVTIGQPLAGGRFVARVSDTARLDGINAGTLEPLTVDHKIAPSARQSVGRGRTWAHVKVYFQRDVDFDDARSAILAAGGAMPDPFRLRFAPGRRLDATIAPHALEALAADERVLIVTGQRKLRVESHNANSARVSNVTPLYDAPYGLSGEGVTLSYFELGAAQASHPEFEGRLTVHFTGGDGGHSTHVAGTMIAAGINPSAKGMAPKARLNLFCVGSDGNNDCTNNWLDDKDTLLKPLGVSADNNSWGYVLGWTSDPGDMPVWLDAEESMGGYEVELGIPAIDEISIANDILFVHSAGNEGDGQFFDSQGWSEHRHVDGAGETITDKVFCYSRNATGTDCPTNLCTGGCDAVKHDPNLPFDTMGATAAAKNVVAVGAVNASGSFIDVTFFSSRGPAKDGRVKPDVVARGAGVTSTIPNNLYGPNQGTSMSAPAVTGITALLVEQWRRTFGAGSNPKPEHLKALLIAGARDVGNPGPDYTFGFGMVDAKRSVDTIIADGGTGQRIRTLNFTGAAGQTIESEVTVTEPQTLRVVLNWPDPPVFQLATDDPGFKTLVNDLDVRVVDPAGNTHLPYVLNKAVFRDPATRGVNTVDNVEMLEIPNAAPGVYRVIVEGKSVPEGPQTAILVTSASQAATEPPPPPCFDPAENGRSNDTAQTAIANLAAGQLVIAAICDDDDADFYTFTATQAGPVSVSITARDTPLFVTLTGALPIEVPANSTRTIASNAVGAAPTTFTLGVIALDGLGDNSQYRFTPEFGTAAAPRRRSVR